MLLEDLVLQVFQGHHYFQRDQEFLRLLRGLVVRLRPLLQYLHLFHSLLGFLLYRLFQVHQWHQLLQAFHCFQPDQQVLQLLQRHHFQDHQDFLMLQRVQLNQVDL